MLRKCIVLAVILAMIFSLSACDLVPTKAPTEPATPGATPTTTEELKAIKITAYELAEEYEVNEIAADHKYKNHILTTVGKIVSISRDPQTGKAYVSLSTGASHYSLGSEVIRCFFTDEAELLNFAVGEEIIIKGKCLGKEKKEKGTSFPILLENCSLVEQSEFEVVDWKITHRPKRWLELEISFTKFGYSLDYFLENPEGTEIEGEAGYHAEQFYEYTCADTEGKAYFELRGIPPGSRQYKLLVKDSKGKVVATKTFSFSGASPRIEVVDYKFYVLKGREGWSKKPGEPWMPPPGFCCLYEITFEIKNSGDLPLYIPGAKLLILVNDQSYLYGFPDLELWPGEQGIFKASTGGANYGLWFSSSGEQELILRFIGFMDDTDRAVYSMNAPITVPEKPLED